MKDTFLDQLPEWGPPVKVEAGPLPMPEQPDLAHWGEVAGEPWPYVWDPNDKNWKKIKPPVMSVCPIQFQYIDNEGLYLHIDPEYQKSSKKRYGKDPYGGWFYRLTPEGWRDADGCLDAGPFEPDDLFVGPIAMEEI